MSRRTSGAEQARNAIPVELGSFLDALVAAIADRVVERLGGEHEGWASQSESPLGSRRHRTAVCRRMAAGLPGAAKVGRKHLLSRDALAEELEALGKKSTAPKRETDDLEAKLRAELGLGGVDE